MPDPCRARFQRPSLPERLLLTGLLSAAVVVLAALLMAREPAKRMDPAAWGRDHVGQEFPEYLTGDECLFCHRKIGATWGENRHQLTIRPAAADAPALRALRQMDGGPPLAAATTHLMGTRRITRFLRRSKEYGKLELLSTSFVPRAATPGDEPPPPVAPHPGRLRSGGSPKWDGTTFAERCAGCHTTAVDASTGAFSAISLDCFVCHGDVPLVHTKDIRRVLLSSEFREPRQVVSLCGQCHLRGGRSQSLGRPFPNTFVAGDNLFRDFRVDFSDSEIRALPAIEQHVFLNARDVAVYGRSAVTCLTCHDVHGEATDKHQQLEDAAICASCHVAGTGHRRLRDGVLPAHRLGTPNRICDY